MRRVTAIAKESNEAIIVDRVLELRNAIKRSFAREDLAAAERLIRDAETVVELDAGGKSMFGLPVAQMSPALRKAMEKPEQELRDALAKADLDAAKSAFKAIANLLGTNAGVPDLRRRGDTIDSKPISPADLAKLFVDAVSEDPRRLKALTGGGLGQGSVARSFAAVVQGCIAVRPLVAMHHPTKLETIDGLVRGCCSTLVARQTPAGYFTVPDLRGKNYILGDTIDEMIERDRDAITGDWIIAPLPDGGSLQDATECGIALLRAGKQYRNEQWTRAGLKTVDWALQITSATNYHLNASSVSLFCEAFRATADRKHLDAGLARHRLAVAPATQSNGRLMNPVGARTTNHVILLRSLHDLEELLGNGPDRVVIKSLANAAIKSLVEESDKLGVPGTSHTIQVLERHLRLHADADRKVMNMLHTAATAAVYKCTSGDRPRAAVPLPELAAVGLVWGK